MTDSGLGKRLSDAALEWQRTGRLASYDELRQDYEVGAPAILFPGFLRHAVDDFHEFRQPGFHARIFAAAVVLNHSAYDNLARRTVRGAE
jgi:hypothetical protein